MPGKYLSISIGLKGFLILGLCVATGSGVHAQKSSQLFKSGDKAFEQKDYRGAIQFYEQGLAQKPDNTKALFRLGFSYLANKQPEQAKPKLLAVHSQTNRFNPELFFMLAQSHHFTHSFDSAMVFYRNYRDRLKSNDLEALDRVEKYIDECRVGQALMKRPVTVKLENMGPAINSPQADFVPVMNQDETLMIFTSRRQGGTGGRLAPDGEPMEDVYYSTREQGKWSQAKNIGEPINSDRHDACVGLSADGNKLYLYKDTNGGDIYVSERQGSGWSKPVSMGPVINSPYYEPSLSISSDGNYAFFSSNRPGGFGGLDIYISVLQADGTWGEALNLGPVINTSYDEDAPYIHTSTNTLYFSSRGHQTMGGHDIFKSDINAFTWSEPVNLGYPINTAADDIHYISPGSSRIAYFSTTRPGGMGRQDIYRVVYPEGEASEGTPAMVYELEQQTVPETPVVTETPKTPVRETAPKPVLTKSEPSLPPDYQMIEGRIVDVASKTPISTRITFTPRETGRPILHAMSDSVSGQFSIAVPIGYTYAVSAGKPGYAYHSSIYVLPPKDSPREANMNISLKKINVGDNLVLHNIYFETNQAEVRPNAYLELNQLYDWLQENPRVRLEIGGHTDNTGSASANMVLSRRRAEAVHKYLVQKGIDPERLTAKGYGITQPVAPNNTAAGRTKNRRTEYRIIGN